MRNQILVDIEFAIGGEATTVAAEISYLYDQVDGDQDHLDVISVTVLNGSERHSAPWLVPIVVGNTGLRQNMVAAATQKAA